MIGGIVAGLNHAMHKMGNREDPPRNKKGEKKISQKTKNIVKVTKNVAASIEFIDAMDKSLKGNNKVLGKFGKVGGYLSAGGQIIYDGMEFLNGEISGYRFTFRMGATSVGYIAGTEVGAALGGTLGGPIGFATGTVIGVGALGVEKAWDVFKQGVNGFINSMTTNWINYTIIK